MANDFLYCKECGKLANRYAGAIYCSRKCADRWQSRNYAKRNRYKLRNKYQRDTLQTRKNYLNRVTKHLDLIEVYMGIFGELK